MRMGRVMAEVMELGAACCVSAVQWHGRVPKVYSEVEHMCGHHACLMLPAGAGGPGDAPECAPPDARPALCTAQPAHGLLPRCVCFLFVPVCESVGSQCSDLGVDTDPPVCALLGLRARLLESEQPALLSHCLLVPVHHVLQRW